MKASYEREKRIFEKFNEKEGSNPKFKETRWGA